jgi:hypothetical protein
MASISGMAGPNLPQGGRGGKLLYMDDAIELGNEFAQVEVRRVRTRNGVRLEIRSPRLGRAIRLCPLVLESLTWQDERTFSRFLETPFGPETP